MNARLRTGLTVAACLVLYASVTHAKTFVVTPSVEWEALVPYVRANVVAELAGNDVKVYVGLANPDKTAIEPFDEALSDFTRVLITETMRGDEAVEAAITSATTSFQRQLPQLSADDRKAFRKFYWDTLTRSPYFLPRLQARFAAARKEGRLRCWLCEKQPSYAPKAPRAGKR